MACRTVYSNFSNETIYSHCTALPQSCPWCGGNGSWEDSAACHPFPGSVPQDPWLVIARWSPSSSPSFATSLCCHLHPGLTPKPHQANTTKQASKQTCLPSVHYTRSGSQAQQQICQQQPVGQAAVRRWLQVVMPRSRAAQRHKGDLDQAFPVVVTSGRWAPTYWWALGCP